MPKSTKRNDLTVFSVRDVPTVDDVASFRWKHLLGLLAHNVGRVAWAIDNVAKAIHEMKVEDRA